MNKKFVIIYLLSIVILFGGILWINKMRSDARNIPAIGTSFPIQGQEHIAVGATHPEYNSNPPTSGWHYAQPATWGVHQDELPDEQLIHNLEHGGIWISYKDVDPTTKSELERIARSNQKVILTPRSKNDAPIVLASWGRSQKLEKFDRDAIINFIKANKNKSPEPYAS